MNRIGKKQTESQGILIKTSKALQIYSSISKTRKIKFLLKRWKKV